VSLYKLKCVRPIKIPLIWIHQIDGVIVSHIEFFELSFVDLYQISVSGFQGSPRASNDAQGDILRNSQPK